MAKKEGKSEKDLMRRFLAGEWKRDVSEYETFVSDLVLADTEARETASMIEENMTLYFIEKKKYDLIYPLWLADYKGVLTRKFEREEMLKVMQLVMAEQNLKGYTYVEELDLMRYVWERYKN